MFYKCGVEIEVDGAALKTLTVLQADSDDQARAAAVDYYENVSSFTRIVQVVVIPINPTLSKVEAKE